MTESELKEITKQVVMAMSDCAKQGKKTVMELDFGEEEGTGYNDITIVVIKTSSLKDGD